MKTRMLLAVLAVGMLPALAAAQTPDERIAAARQRAAEAGIPVQLLEAKIAEGRAKGVPMERIAAAVEARAAGLAKAAEALGRRPDVTDAELGLGADALQAGVSEAVLAAIAERAPGERRAVAIAALTQLVQMGQVPEHALARVTEALARGPEAPLKLPAQAQAAQRQGPPAGMPGAGAGADRPAGPPAGVPAPGQPGSTAGPPKPPGPPGGPPAGPPGGPPGGGE
jgi:hypothetical protein